MEELLAKIDINNSVTLHQLVAFMDGGTIVLTLTDQHLMSFSVTFCQRMDVRIFPNTGNWVPSSLLLNDIAVPIGSTSEREILDALKAVKFSNIILPSDRIFYQKKISESVQFTESADYLETARTLGRIPS